MKEFNSSGELIIQDATIAEPGSPVNKSYVDSSVSDKADISYVDSAVSPMAEKSYVDGLVPLGSFMGTGSPEGNVSAPVGAIYVDSAATNGAIRWIKTSATGSTGWRVEHGDTGWREIVPINGWAGSIYIRRTNSTVFYRGKIDAKTATSGTAWDIPLGFRIGNLLSTQGQGYEYGRAIVSTDENEPKIRNVNFYFSKFSINGYSTAHVYGINVSYSTPNEWPSSLPGTPA